MMKMRTLLSVCHFPGDRDVGLERGEEGLAPEATSAGGAQTAGDCGSQPRAWPPAAPPRTSPTQVPHGPQGMETLPCLPSRPAECPCLGKCSNLRGPWRFGVLASSLLTSKACVCPSCRPRQSCVNLGAARGWGHLWLAASLLPASSPQLWLHSHLCPGLLSKLNSCDISEGGLPGGRTDGREGSGPPTGALPGCSLQGPGLEVCRPLS